MWETWVRSLGWKESLEEGMAAHSSILALRIPTDRGAWWATVRKELDMTVTKHTHTSLVLLYFFLLLPESPTFFSLFRFCFYFYIIGKHKSY